MSKTHEQRLAYARQWYANNRDRLTTNAHAKSPEQKTAKKASVLAWRAKNRARLLEESRARYAKQKQENPTAVLAAKRLAYHRDKAQNPEAVLRRGRESSKRYRANHPDRRPTTAQTKDYSKRSRDRLRAAVLTHYGGQCACCGEDKNEFLCIDHLNGNGAAHRRALGVKSGAGPIYRWLKLHDYPVGFRVLCHNCNMAYGFYGRCPHQAT